MKNLEVRYKHIRAYFDDFTGTRSIRDGFLHSIGAETRKDIPMAIEPVHGITYVRDDAVRDLLDYIRELRYNTEKE